MKVDKVLAKKYKISKEESAVLYKRSKGEKVIYVIMFCIFFVYAVSLVFPFLWLLVNSFQNRIIYQINMSDGNAFALPKKLEIANYIYAFKELSYNGSNIFNMFFGIKWDSCATVPRWYFMFTRSFLFLLHGCGIPACNSTECVNVCQGISAKTVGSVDTACSLTGCV